MLKLVAVGMLSVVIAGCAVSKKSSPEVEAAARQPLYCEGPDECSRLWRRAQVWVATNSRWKIQTATDAVIVTFTPPRGEIHRGYQVTREPLAGGREQIMISSGCSNMFGCSTDEAQVALDFKTFVKAQK